MIAPFRGQKLGYAISHRSFAQLGSLAFESCRGGKVEGEGVPAKNITSCLP